MKVKEAFLISLIFFFLVSNIFTYCFPIPKEEKPHNDIPYGEEIGFMVLELEKKNGFTVELSVIDTLDRIVQDAIDEIYIDFLFIIYLGGSL